MADRDSRRYYWLKLEKDFFKRHDIRIIESQPNGKDYIIFYLKLLCEATSHEGYLRFSETIPYNEDMLSTITNTNIDIVRSAIKIFTELQMMQILDDGTYYFNQVEKMIGSETGGAERKRMYREAQKQLIGTSVGQCPLEIEKDIEIDKELDIDKNIDACVDEEEMQIEIIKSFMQQLEELFNGKISPKNRDIAIKMCEEYGSKTTLNEIKRNIDKDNPIGYANRVLQSSNKKDVLRKSEWGKEFKESFKEETKFPIHITSSEDAYKYVYDDEAPEELRQEARAYINRNH